ncbi:hypothetical protein BCR35DRAFT_300547 [Leucosporidium creatinivorum]|uniref:Uncharacterized protein n=1 Tax=Leucosporidium creatinivorum TaxID=106004 RepID=A0A1Y2FZ35_9BASI|nr:hypothetical protein BCR35DRAFT_300547 [Leucosporidium creatinivorum]
MSSGRDPRAHVRADSVAYRRTPQSPEKKSTIKVTPPTPNRDQSSTTTSTSASTSTRPLTGTPSAPLPTSRQLSRLIRLFLLLTSLFSLWHFLISPWSHQKQVQSLIKSRKLRLQGVGESHVLPKRWRDSMSTGGGGKGELPECKRVMLFKFSGTHGFSSEINLYVRASVIASKLGYTLLADDVDWNFGSLQDYFLPRQIHCLPPSDWFLPTSATPLGAKRWASSDRLWFGRSLAAHADKWLRDEILDSEAMQELKGRSFGPLLPEGETLPASLEEIFVDFSAGLRELWKPNDELAIMIRRQRMELGLGEGGLRHRKNSPTWGGNRRHGTTRDRVAVEEVEDEDDHDYEEAGGAERSDRGPVIGAHLGNMREKTKELRLAGIKKGTIGGYSASVEGVNEALSRLSKSTLTSPGYSRGHPTLFPPTSQPSIILLSPNRTLASTLSWISPSTGSNYSLSLPSSPPLAELKRWNQVLRIELTEELAAPVGSVDQSRIVDEWELEVWNTLPRGLRVYLTKWFLRDLTTLALYADAFVVHASTNTGRLICLLAGEDAVVGPREISGKGLGGRVRSVDGWWVPSSGLEALWGEGQ